MKVLVLGGAGFLGQHIVEALLDHNYQVRVYDRQSHQFRRNNIETFSGDFSDTMLLSEALEGVDTVIHLISTSVPSTSNKDPVSDINGNLINTIRLLELMKSAGVKDIVYFSSGGTVYGHPQSLPMTEDHITHPICSYGIVKLAVEKYLNMYAELHSFNAVILRPSNPYGPGQTHLGVQGFIGTCIHAALTESNLTIWGDGEIKRDYLYISDLVDATTAALKFKRSETFNISSQQGHSLNGIVGLVQRYTGKKINVIYQTKRNFDIPEVTLSNSKAKTLLNWQPIINLDEGLSKTVMDALAHSKV